MPLKKTTDTEFEQMLADRQHLDMMNTLNQLLQKFKQDDDTEVVEKLTETNALMQKLLSKETSMDMSCMEDMTKALQENNQLIAKLIEEKSRPKSIEFNRNTLGLIISPITIS